MLLCVRYQATESISKPERWNIQSAHNLWKSMVSSQPSPFHNYLIFDFLEAQNILTLYICRWFWCLFRGLFLPCFEECKKCSKMLSLYYSISLIQTSQTGDQLYSNASPNSERSLAQASEATICVSSQQFNRTQSLSFLNYYSQAKDGVTLKYLRQL